MRKILLAGWLILITSQSFAAELNLICITNGDLPAVDFKISNENDDQSITMVITEMSGDTEVYSAKVNSQTVDAALKAKSFYSLVLAASNAEMKYDNFISKAAMVTMVSGKAKIAVNGMFLRTGPCN